jgi:hypothetical protein
MTRFARTSVTAIPLLLIYNTGLAAEFFWIGDLLEGELESTVRDISADGNVVVGNFRTKDGVSFYRWVRDGSITFGPAPSSVSHGARHVSADGTVIVGQVGPPLRKCRRQGEFAYRIGVERRCRCPTHSV